MFKIEDNIIYLTRGDKATISIEIEDYTFIQGDVIKFSIYNKKGLENSPVLRKVINVEEEQKVVNIDLSSEDTKKIGPIENKGTEYWYEVELNGNITVLGYDEDGPKILILYPEGSDDTNVNDDFEE